MGKSERIRVVGVEPSERWRQHLALLFGESTGPVSICFADSLSDVLRLLGEGGADLVLAGFDEQSHPASEIALVRARFPTVPIIAVGIVQRPEVLVSLLVSGADAVVSKAESSLQILEAMSTVRQGGAYLSVSLARLLVDALRSNLRQCHHLDGLSRRELDVLRLLSTGLTDQEIGGHLGIATRTVSTHLQNIYGKLAVRTRAAAVAKYYGQSAISGSDVAEGAGVRASEGNLRFTCADRFA